MSVVEASDVVNAPREKVWRVVADPRNLPGWDRRIIRVIGARKDQIREGDDYDTEIGFMGVRTRIPVHVEVAEAPEYCRFVLGGILTATIETWLQSLPGGRTRLSHRVEYRFRGGLIGRLAAQTVGLVGAATLLRHGIEAQKEQIEAG
jgi:ligand-binding SRPBCC domain-containing protein